MKCATFNVLADAYIGYGNYSHVNPELLLPGARTEALVELINGLEVDVIGLQEVEPPLVRALGKSGLWQTFWSPKGRDKPDGCLMLVKHGLSVGNFQTHAYSDESGHVGQTVDVNRITFANTHIKWAPPESDSHIGVAQTVELMAHLGESCSAVVLADCNDRPGGPVRGRIEASGFLFAHDDKPTALINQQPVAIDVIAVRGIRAKQVSGQYKTANIPNNTNPSDHIPLIAELTLGE